MHGQLPKLVALLLLLIFALLGCQSGGTPTPQESTANLRTTPTAEAASERTPSPQPTSTPKAQVSPEETPTLHPTMTPSPSPISTAISLPTPEPTVKPTPEPEPDPLQELVHALRANGFSIQVGEQAEFLLSVPTTHLRVDNRDAFAYIFESDEASLEESTRIATSGSSIGRRQYLWPTPPSFFRMGQLILFLISEDRGLLEALEQFFGPRFAGGEVPGFDVVPIVPNAAEVAARSDLAERLGVTRESLMLVRVTPAEFQDTSLGCPKDGTGYDQVTVDGYALLYDRNGVHHSYHVSADGRIGTDCPSPTSAD